MRKGSSWAILRPVGYCHKISLRSKRLSNIGRAVLGNATRKARGVLALLAFPYSYRRAP